MTEKQLRERDAKRDLGVELLQSIREMTAGTGRVAAKIEVPAVVMARMRSRLSQSEFASLLGVSVRTLQALGTRPQAAVWRGAYFDHHCRAVTQSFETGFEKHGHRVSPDHEKHLFRERRYFANRVSDKPIMREISQGWKMNISYSEDGSIIEIVLLDAKKEGLLPLEHR